MYYEKKSNNFFEQPPVTEGMINPLSAEWNKRLVEKEQGEQLISLIDFSQLNELFENFLNAIGLPVVIIDLKGAALASSRWRRVCMEFHRANEDTLARCIESDIEIYKQISSGKQFYKHKCKNGLIDCCTPIVIEGRHIANLFSGQFFVQKPDEEFFDAMAEQFGFEKSAYLKAIHEVPIISEEKIESIMKMLVS